MVRLFRLVSVYVALHTTLVFAQSPTFEDDHFVGRYTAAANSDKMPVIVLGGSEGGFPDRLEKPVIAAGHPVLSVAYFKHAALPAELEHIPLEYFGHALSWLRKNNKQAAEGIMVVGWSKGAELALILASEHSEVQRVIAIAPSSVVWAGILSDYTKVPGSSWTKGGEPLPHVPFKPAGKVNGLLDLYTQSLANRADNGAADIHVESIAASVLLLTGSDDEIWPSPAMASTVCDKLNEASEGQCRHVNLNGRGHLLDEAFTSPQGELYEKFQGWLGNSEN
tara:strand:- start:36 stop:875 length:840 start_codon:yes stop_codon:yes gene_type:complete